MTGLFTTEPIEVGHDRFGRLPDNYVILLMINGFAPIRIILDGLACSRYFHAGNCAVGAQ